MRSALTTFAHAAQAMLLVRTAHHEHVYEYVGPPLTRNTLDRLLTARGVPDRTYDLHGAHKHDAFVLDHRPEGWIVFYSEKGGEDILSLHDSEADACLDILNRLLERQRGERPSLR